MYQIPARDTSPEISELTLWVYELLDAHRDTASLAAELESDHEWRAHLDYLRDLQRHARESLAQVHGMKYTDSPEAERGRGFGTHGVRGHGSWPHESGGVSSD